MRATPTLLPARAPRARSWPSDLLDRAEERADRRLEGRERARVLTQERFDLGEPGERLVELLVGALCVRAKRYQIALCVVRGDERTQPARRLTVLGAHDSIHDTRERCRYVYRGITAARGE